MNIVHYTKTKISTRKDVCRACEELAKQAQREGYLGTDTYIGDAGTLVAFGDDGSVLGYASISEKHGKALDGF